MNTVIYFHTLNSIGGVETWLYNLALKHKFTFYYKLGDSDQVKRLAKLIPVKKYNGEHIKCDKFIVNYNPDIIDNVEANEYIMMIHCDYNAVKFNPIMHPKITKYVGVSQYVCDAFTNLTGVPSEVMYNPVEVSGKYEKKKGLHLISATRLTSEKGGWRIDKLSEMLDKAGVKYTWDIYTNRNCHFTSKNIHRKLPKLDLSKEIGESSYLVQLSNAEAFCYSVVESLLLNTPVIITDLPVYKELGITDKHAIRVDMDLKEVDIDKIVNGKFNFKYTPPKSDWDKYFTDFEYNPEEKVEVEVLKRRLWLIEEDVHLVRGDKIKVSRVRASELESAGCVKW